MSQLSTLRSIGYLKVTGVLVTQTPIRVGSSKSDGDIDLPVLRDGQGRVLIPGSSLAGSVRSSCRDLGIEESLVNRLFGETEDGDKDAVGDTSWFSFSDTAIDHPVEFRNGVGIDRRTGTAAAQALYSYEVLPRGVRLPFSMEVELPSGAVSDFRREEIEEVLKKILAGMARGEVSVGAIQASTGDMVYGLDFGTASVDPASIAATTRGSVTFTLTGAKTTDIIIVNPPSDLNDDLIYCGAAISAANTVSIYLYNPTASAINDTARTFSYVWIDMTA